jgi:hypothetical protein
LSLSTDSERGGYVARSRLADAVAGSYRTVSEQFGRVDWPVTRSVTTTQFETTPVEV